MNMLEQARYWRENLHGYSELSDALEKLDDDMLIKAYNRWWSVYTWNVQNVPAKRKVNGISKYDALKAGKAATDATFELLEETNE